MLSIVSKGIWGSKQLADKQNSRLETIKNNQNHVKSEHKIKNWDENLAKLFRNLYKYLPEDFPLIEIHDAEKGIFIYSSTFDKVSIKISRDGKKILSQFDENEVQRKVQSGDDLRILLSNYVNDRT